MTPRDKKVCDFLVDVESLKLKAYPDSKGIITIAVGLARHYLDGSPIKLGDTCTKEQAMEWLLQYLKKEVYRAVKAISDDLPDSVFVALCSFGYNEGCGYFHHDSFTETISNQDWGTWEGYETNTHGHIDYHTTKATGLAHTLIQYDKITVDGARHFHQGLHNRRVKEIKYMLKGLE
jgi:GH24 family phage-related lysozyme (muramidase)